MSMAAVSTIAAKTASSPAGGTAATGKTSAGTAFAAMVAGAAKPDASAPASKGVRAGDKTQHARHDEASTHDDDDSQPAVADGSTAIPLSLPTGTPAATAPTSAKSEKPGADRATRTASTTGASSASASGADTDVDLTQSPVDTTDATLAPVLAALADSLAAKQASDQPASADAAPVPETALAAPATPTTATAALMSARIGTGGAPFSGSADARSSAASSRKTADDAGPDSTVAAPDGTAPVPTALSVATATTVASTSHAPASGDAAGQLASGAADRQLDLAKQGAWLDGISHDIAATAAGSSAPLRFAVAPQHLGAVQVEMTRGGDGTAVTLTASSEAGRIALADARPQLIAEARAQGIHIASAQVDVGSGQTGADSRQPASGQGDSHASSHSAGGDGNFSGQAGAQGDSGRQLQTRSQPLAAKRVASSGSTDADTATEPTDGLYA